VTFRVDGRAIVDAILVINGKGRARQGAGIHTSKPTPKPPTIANRMGKATGARSICFPRSSRDRTAIYPQQIVNCDLEIEKLCRSSSPAPTRGEKSYHPTKKRIEAGKQRRRKTVHPHTEFDMRTETDKLF